MGLFRQESMRLQTRGRKLVLQYTGGSPCGKSAKSKRDSRAVHDGATYKYEDYVDDEDASTEDKTQATRTKSHDDEDDEDEDDKHKESDRRKSTIISFLCDRDPLATHAAVHFVGTDPDECAYFFEVRSQHACIAAEPHQPGTIGPGGVFGLIVGIALVVYFAGGIFYQRTVAHARGWRQLPNHNIWQGIWTFISVRWVSSMHQRSSISQFTNTMVGRTLSLSAQRHAQGSSLDKGAIGPSRGPPQTGGTGMTRIGSSTSLMRSGTIEPARDIDGNTTCPLSPFVNILSFSLTHTPFLFSFVIELVLGRVWPRCILGYNTVYITY